MLASSVYSYRQTLHSDGVTYEVIGRSLASRKEGLESHNEQKRKKIAGMDRSPHAWNPLEQKASEQGGAPFHR